VKKLALTVSICTAAMLIMSAVVVADTLELKDGKIYKDCYARDEGIHFLVWEKMEDVGTPKMLVIPRSAVKEWKHERKETWDAKPSLPDLSVTFIEMNPKLQGLHGKVDYDKYSRPILRTPSRGNMPDDEAAMKPEELTKGCKFNYKPGEEITLTAHVKNVGFVTAKPFSYVWLIDGREVSRGKYTKQLKEMEETTFPIKYKWQEGQHTATFRIITDEKEIATINNEINDPLWGYSFFYVVHKGQVAAWHTIRNACGTFSFEDYYRWHIDLMNTLFAASVYPCAPTGIKARVRLDRILYVDDLKDAQPLLNDKDGFGLHQGGWMWGASDEEKKSGKFNLPTREWYTNTEWSLPHELGHQLGLVDYYAIDYQGNEDHVWPDNGEPICHFQNHPEQMMHWHGPNLYGELDAGYFNMTWDKPRGHFGDYYFATPAECFLQIVDVNGLPLVGAKIECFQRGTEVDPNGQPQQDQGVTYYPVIEDGDFGKPLSKQPVIVGSTNSDGIMRLPNRPVMPVRTFNGYERKPNPFGNMDVVGGRDLMMIKITYDNKPTYYFLELYDLCVQWFRGNKDKATFVIKTPYRSTSSPLAPTDVKVEDIGGDKVKISWKAPKVIREQQYLDRVIGYKVYRRIGPMGLNDRPWFPVATVGPETTEVIVDLKQRPEDVYWFTLTNRYAVSSLGELSMESELVEAPIPPFKK